MFDTYRGAVLLAVVLAAGVYIGLAAEKHATAVTALPYGAGVAVSVALAFSALVAYRRR